MRIVISGDTVIAVPAANRTFDMGIRDPSASSVPVRSTAVGADANWAPTVPVGVMAVRLVTRMSTRGP